MLELVVVCVEVVFVVVLVVVELVVVETDASTTYKTSCWEVIPLPSAFWEAAA